MSAEPECWVLARVQGASALATTNLGGVFILVSMATITSDSFTGLRALLIPNKKKPGAHKRRGCRAMFGAEGAGRWSLLETDETLGQPQTNSWHWRVLDE